MALILEKKKQTPATMKAPAATRPPMKKSPSGKAARPSKGKGR